jgi:hypothetical protein
MNFLPPSRESVLNNLRLLAHDWRASGAQGRYFIASQVLSTLLIAVCAMGSLAAIVAGDWKAYLGLVMAGAICFAHTVGTWTVLKRRFLVRYELL